VTPIALKLPDVSVVNVVIAVFPNSKVYGVDGVDGVEKWSSRRGVQHWNWRLYLIQQDISDNKGGDEL